MDTINKCKECGQDIPIKSLEEIFIDRSHSGSYEFFDLAQIAKEHYQKKLDEAEKTAGYLDNNSNDTGRFINSNDIRKAMFGK